MIILVTNRVTEPSTQEGSQLCLSSKELSRAPKSGMVAKYYLPLLVSTSCRQPVDLERGCRKRKLPVGSDTMNRALDSSSIQVVTSSGKQCDPQKKGFPT